MYPNTVRKRPMTAAPRALLATRGRHRAEASNDQNLWMALGGVT